MSPAPQPGLHHVSAGLDAVMARLAERTQAEAPDDPAVAAFAEMVAAIHRGDFQSATRHRRRLNTLGFNVLVRAGGGR
jgi:hypothetical protein